MTRCEISVCAARNTRTSRVYRVNGFEVVPKGLKSSRRTLQRQACSERALRCVCCGKRRSPRHTRSIRDAIECLDGTHATLDQAQDMFLQISICNVFTRFTMLFLRVLVILGGSFLGGVLTTTTVRPKRALEKPIIFPILTEPENVEGSAQNPWVGGDSLFDLQSESYEHSAPERPVELVEQTVFMNNKVASVSSRSGSSDTTCAGSTELQLNLQLLQRSQDENKCNYEESTRNSEQMPQDVCGVYQEFQAR